jgi:hypothetical protein
MKEIFYKGYLITVTPDQLADNHKWTTHVVISRDRGHSVTMKPFHASNIFDTKEQAIEHSLNFGIQIVDGQYKNCSLDDV